MHIKKERMYSVETLLMKQNMAGVRGGEIMVKTMTLQSRMHRFEIVNKQRKIVTYPRVTKRFHNRCRGRLENAT